MSTILLAEADRDFRIACNCFLSRNGHRVKSAEDGLACLAELRRAVPDLLVLDLEIPWGGGDGVLEILREDPRLAPAQILFTSTVEAAEFFNPVASPRTGDVLIKPFHPAVLLEHATFAKSIKDVRPNKLRGCRGVLLAENDDAIRKMLQTFLKREGFRVWAARNSEEALELFCAHGTEIAVFLLDVQLPAIGGARMFECVRQFDPKMPICFMAGDAVDYDMSDLLQLGARRIFGKPLRMVEIVDGVRDLVEGHGKSASELAAGTAHATCSFPIFVAR